MRNLNSFSSEFSRNCSSLKSVNCSRKHVFDTFHLIHCLIYNFRCNFIIFSTLMQQRQTTNIYFIHLYQYKSNINFKISILFFGTFCITMQKLMSHGLVLLEIQVMSLILQYRSPIRYFEEQQFMFIESINGRN